MTSHSIETLRRQLSEEREIHSTSCEEIYYHNRMLIMKKKHRDESHRNISDLEQSISELESKLIPEG